MHFTAKYLGLLFFAAFISLTGCKKDDNNNNNNNNNPQKILKYLTIANAKSLVIVSSMKKDGNGNKLFKITSNGYFLEVPCIDQNGETVTSSFSPLGICNISDNYLTVNFMNYGINLVRKSDGVVFKGDNLPGSTPDPRWALRMDLLKQQDSAGNIYCLYKRNVIKLSITDPNNLTVSGYSAPGDIVKIFIVDKAGNMAYSQEQDAVSRFR